MGRKVACLLRTYDELELTKGALKSLLDNTPQMDLLIIVDGYCEDCKEQVTRNFLKKWTSPIPTKKVFLDKAYWSTYAWNEGLKAVPPEYDYLLLVDNDIRYQENWLETMIKLLDTHERAAEVVPLYCKDDWEVYGTGFLFDDAWKEELELWGKLKDLKVPYPVLCPTSSCALFRLEALRSCNFWDPKVVSWIELWMGLKLYSNGWKVYVQPSSKVVHLEGGSYTKDRHKSLTRDPSKFKGLEVYRFLREVKSKFPEGLLEEVQDRIKKRLEELRNRNYYRYKGRFTIWDIVKKGEFREKELFCSSWHDYEKFFQIKDGDKVLDLGATVGSWSIKVAKENPKSKIFALEPHPLNYKALEENLLSTCTANVKPLEKAVWSSSGEEKFLGKRHPIDKGKVTPKGEIVVKTQSLDDLFSKLGPFDFMKMDIEGNETKVLNAWTKIPKEITCVVEFHENKKGVVEFFKKHCFKEIHVTNRPEKDTGLVHARRKVPWNLGREAFKERFKKEGDLFIDVGASVGQWSFPLSRHYKEVWAVEPHPVNLRTLKKTKKELRTENVKIVPIAISLREGKIQFYSGEPEHTERVGLAGIKKRYYRSKLKGIQEFLPLKKVKSLPFHRVLGSEEADLVKVDVEGAEEEVVRSAKPVMGQVKKWVVEVHSPEKEKVLESIFKEAGLKVEHLDPTHLYAFRKGEANE